MLAPSQHVQKIQRNSPKILDFIYFFIFMLANSLALNDMRSDIGCETHAPPSLLPPPSSL